MEKIRLAITEEDILDSRIRGVVCPMEAALIRTSTLGRTSWNVTFSTLQRKVGDSGYRVLKDGRVFTTKLPPEALEFLETFDDDPDEAKPTAEFELEEE